MLTVQLGNDFVNGVGLRFRGWLKSLTGPQQFVI
jgi:hypothetical protein